MNSIFHDKSNKFVIIYVDDILVYSKSMEKHVEHLKSVLKKLGVNSLYTNQLKSEYLSLEMEFLGTCFISRKGQLDLKKIQTIKEW
jgi:hypothetical protein